MKKLNQKISKTGMKTALSIGLLVLMVSCSKQEDPSPSNNQTTTTTTTTTTTSSDNPICEDSICKLPFRIMSVFLPSGFYDTGDQGVELLIDGCDEVPAYTGEGLRLKYTKGATWGWGAHFLNDNNWDGTFKITPTATKITFYARVDYSANVTFNAFADVDYGKVELYEKANPVTPVWEKITIPLLGKPATFSAPLNIVIDGNIPEGTVTVVDIKDVLFE